MDQPINPAATDHLPFFITPPGHTDILFVIIVVFLISAILFLGNVYFQLHALPERMAHKRSKVQMEIVAVLALIALFTHEHIFWIAALLLALVDLPDLSTPIISIAQSLEKLSGREPGVEPRPVLETDQPVLLTEEPLSVETAEQVAQADAGKVKQIDEATTLHGHEPPREQAHRPAREAAAERPSRSG